MGEKAMCSYYGPKKTAFDKFYKRELCKLNEWRKMKHVALRPENVCIKLRQ